MGEIKNKRRFQGTPKTTDYIKIDVNGKDVRIPLSDLFPPRMTKVQREAIISPTTGLLVEQTNEIEGFYRFNGVTWKKLIDSAPYKSYVAILEQSGTSAPTVNVLENTLGGIPVWSYSSQGNYDCTLSGAFTQNKIIFFTSQYPDVKINVQQISTNVIRVVSCDTSGGSEFPFDGLMDNISLEIRVYE